MSRQLKYVIGTIVVLGCILCGIGIFSSLDSKGKMTHYSCNTKPDNEGEGPILKQHYEFDYSLKEEKVVDGTRSLSIVFGNKESYDSTKEKSTWTEGFEPDDVEEDNKNLTITYIWKKPLKYNKKETYSIEEYLSFMSTFEYECKEEK